MFRDRADAAQQLAARFERIPLQRPIVLAVPRGGVALGAPLARILVAELDVVLARKLRAPFQPELAVGSVAETGHTFVNESVARSTEATAEYLAEEKAFQLGEIERRKKLFRGVRPPADLTDRTVIVTDDGIATGATMLAALQSIRLQHPREIILAVPVAAPGRLRPLQKWCDRVICLDEPATFWSVGQFYKNFTQLEDADVVALLQDSASGGLPSGIRHRE